MFSIKIETTNAAFDDNPEHQLGLLLDKVKTEIEFGFTSGKLRDINGNTVGEWNYGTKEN